MQKSRQARHSSATLVPCLPQKTPPLPPSLLPRRRSSSLLQSRSPARLKCFHRKLYFKEKSSRSRPITWWSPGGVDAHRDVIRHNGSVVILAVDRTRNPADPDILLIRQYRHAAGQFLLELPAGRLEPGEKPMTGAKRELIEETGYRAKRWSKLVRYFASPGFLTEAMNILLAEELTMGNATPEEDERIEIRMTPLSTCLQMIPCRKYHRRQGPHRCFVFRSAPWNDFRVTQKPLPERFTFRKRFIVGNHT